MRRRNFHTNARGPMMGGPRRQEYELNRLFLIGGHTMARTGPRQLTSQPARDVARCVIIQCALLVPPTYMPILCANCVLRFLCEIAHPIFRISEPCAISEHKDNNHYYYHFHLLSSSFFIDHDYHHYSCPFLQGF